MLDAEGSEAVNMTTMTSDVDTTKPAMSPEDLSGSVTTDDGAGNAVDGVSDNNAGTNSNSGGNDEDGGRCGNGYDDTGGQVDISDGVNSGSIEKTDDRIGSAGVTPACTMTCDGAVKICDTVIDGTTPKEVTPGEKALDIATPMEVEEPDSVLRDKEGLLGENNDIDESSMREVVNVEHSIELKNDTMEENDDSVETVTSMDVDIEGGSEKYGTTASISEKDGTIASVSEKDETITFISEKSGAMTCASENPVTMTSCSRNEEAVLKAGTTVAESIDVDVVNVNDNQTKDRVDDIIGNIPDDEPGRTSGKRTGEDIKACTKTGEEGHHGITLACSSEKDHSNHRDRVGSVGTANNKKEVKEQGGDVEPKDGGSLNDRVGEYVDVSDKREDLGTGKTDKAASEEKQNTKSVEKEDEENGTTLERQPEGDVRIIGDSEVKPGIINDVHVSISKPSLSPQSTDTSTVATKAKEEIESSKLSQLSSNVLASVDQNSKQASSSSKSTIKTSPFSESFVKASSESSVKILPSSESTVKILPSSESSVKILPSSESSVKILPSPESSLKASSSSVSIGKPSSSASIVKALSESVVKTSLSSTIQLPDLTPEKVLKFIADELMKESDGGKALLSGVAASLAATKSEVQSTSSVATKVGTGQKKEPVKPVSVVPVSLANSSSPIRLILQAVPGNPLIPGNLVQSGIQVAKVSSPQKGGNTVRPLTPIAPAQRFVISNLPSGTVVGSQGQLLSKQGQLLTTQGLAGTRIIRMTIPRSSVGLLPKASIVSSVVSKLTPAVTTATTTINKMVVKPRTPQPVATTTSEVKPINKALIQNFPMLHPILKDPKKLINLNKKKWTKRLSRKSIFVLEKQVVRALARRGGLKEVPGFHYNTKWNSLNYPLDFPRPSFRTAWKYRTQSIRTLAAAAIQTRILNASMKWDEMNIRPPRGTTNTLRTSTGKIFILINVIH